MKLRTLRRLIRMGLDEGFSSAIGAVRQGVAWRWRRAWWACKRWYKRHRVLPAKGQAAKGQTAKGGVDPGEAEKRILDDAQSMIASLFQVLPRERAVEQMRSVDTPQHFPVAVVVPAFQAEDYLEDCLNSVMSQTYQDLTCYVVDDASTDATSEIVERLKYQDRRIVHLRHGRNAGLSAARNTGLRNAREPLVTFLDADDLLTPSSLQRRVQRLVLAWGDTAVAGSWAATPQVPASATLGIVKSYDRPLKSQLVDVVSSQGECPFNAHAPLLRTSLIQAFGGFNESLRGGTEDWDLWHRLLRHGYVFVPSGGHSGVYRQTAGSMVRRGPSTHLHLATRLLNLAYEPVILEPELVVDEAAGQPLADVLLAGRVLQRIAIYGGLARASGLPTDELQDFIVEHATRRYPYRSLETLELAAHAQRGIRRGLGLGGGSGKLSRQSDEMLWALSTDIAERIHAAVADVRMLELPNPESGRAINPKIDVDVLLVAERCSDVASMEAFGCERSDEGLTVAALDFDYAAGDQGASQAWSATDTATVAFNDLAFGSVTTRTLVVSRPFGPVVLDLIDAAKRARIGIREVPGNLLIEHTQSMSAKLGSESFATQALDLRDGQERDRPGAIDALPLFAGTHRRSAIGFEDMLISEEGELDPDSSEILLGLQDRHRGETVVIIGNGPSLNDIDLSLLEDTPTFGVNGIFYASDRLVRPLTYYVVEDSSVFHENLDQIVQVEAGLKLFPTNYKRAYLSHDTVSESEAVAFFRMNAGFYGRGTGTECLPRFSFDPVQRLYCGQSVTMINLQLVHWMGFSRVLLIGMDFSYIVPENAPRKGDVLTSVDDDPNHFHKDYFGKGKTWKDPKLDRVLLNYQLAKDVFESTGRTILNCTEGGQLDVFSRMPLMEALKSD